MEVAELVRKDVSVASGSHRSFAKFITSIGAPPFTFLASAYVIGYGAVSNSGPKVAEFSTSFLSPNFFERSKSLQNVSSTLQVMDLAVIMGVVGGILPLVVLVALKLSGAIKSLDLETLKERVIGFLLASGFGVLLLPLLQALEAPPLFFVFLYAHLVATMCLFLLTLYTMKFHWKTSVHSGGAACFCFVSLLICSTSASLWAPLIVGLVSWSRLYLGKHTIGQVVLGVVLGFSCYAAVFSVFDISLLRIS